MRPVAAGAARPLGAARAKRGVNFALYSSRATRVQVCLFDPASGAEQERFDLPARTGDIWHGLVPSTHAGPGTHYAFRVYGPESPQPGDRFDPQIALLDPYARALSTTQPLRSVVVNSPFEWHGDRAPAVAWRNTVIYEMHVKGFTALHPGVPETWRGKYLGLTVASVIEHLKSIGVTAVELLPCQSFISEQFLLERGLSNYWGYNSIAWFSPANEYAVLDAVTEFKTMVKVLHAAGIEVILDVVFNHTAEGNEHGTTYSLRGIDNQAYYRLMREDPRLYENLTGCGNTVNCDHPAVRALIIDCLRYWAEEMHVDGFRFDLGTVLARNDHGFNEHSAFFRAVRVVPSLAHVKLIAEPWDIGLGGYQLGRFPAGWSEWNDRYRDTVRAFWRGDAGKVGELAERLAGSSDLFRHNNRKPTAGINLVTAHDGFTLRDLVTYNERHNEANLENNNDGHGHNLSWNCGVEGPTDERLVNAMRRRQMRNFLATLMFSQGVPMLQAGDEFARTQGGNNNAYCQDNEISWVDWRLRAANVDLLRFMRLIAQLRRQHAEFRRETFLLGAPVHAGAKDVTWLHPRGNEMSEADWNDAQLRTLGMWYGRGSSPVGRLLLLVNADPALQPFALPEPPPGVPWICQFDTTDDVPAVKSLGAMRSYPLSPRSIVLMEC
ncbi:MAG: glycogen debranching protein GlgX [Steroidobacterales bacterium]